MADKEQLAILAQGVAAWNTWRDEHPDVRPDLAGADLSCRRLDKADFRHANLTEADFTHALLHEANLGGANLAGATLVGTNFCRAKLCDAQLSRADLHRANLDRADLTGATLTDANLERTILVGTSVAQAIFTRCRVYGASAWDLDLTDVKDQSELRITREDEPQRITVDNLEVAQFVYLLLHNEKIGDAIHTIGRKGVLIIGRFTDDRRPVLHAIRDELKSRYDLLPILFEFTPLRGETTIKTLSTLAHLARFVIADLTNAQSVLQELTTILDDLPALPIQPIIHESAEMPPMSDSFLVAHSLLSPYVYGSQEKLIADLAARVIGPAEDRARDFELRLAEVRHRWQPWQVR